MTTRALSVVAFLIACLILPAGSATAARDEEGGGGPTSFSNMKGKDILGPGGSGKRLGIVEDVLLGPDDSPFLVLSRGSAFGVVGPFYLIPWQLAAPQIREDAVVIAFDKKIIEKAPAIKMEAWPPDSLSPESIERVHAYYRQVRRGEGK